MTFREKPFRLPEPGQQGPYSFLDWACANFLQNKKGSVK
jgi:hypothetical protein